MSFSIKSGQTALNYIQPNQPQYIPNWKKMLQDLNFNCLRVGSGTSGDTWGLNLWDNPNWAENLNACLENMKEFFVVWQCFDGQWASGFGIDDMNVGLDRLPSFVSKTQQPDPWVKTTTSWGQDIWRRDLTINNGHDATREFLRKLAGNNSVGRNFLADPMFLGWAIGNECYIGNGAGNPTYDWMIDAMQYIKSVGGKTIANCPLYGVGGWNFSFKDTVPLFEGKADIMETHNYLLAEFIAAGKTPTGFIPDIKAQLQNQIDNRGSFQKDNLFLGEMGIWGGAYQDFGLPQPYTFTTQDRINYFTGYFRALKELGWQKMNIYSVLGGLAYDILGVLPQVSDSINTGSRAEELFAYLGNFIIYRVTVQSDSGNVITWYATSPATGKSPEFTSETDVLAWITAQTTVKPTKPTLAARVPTLGNSALVQVYLRQLRNKIISKENHKKLHPLV